MASARGLIALPARVDVSSATSNRFLTANGHAPANGPGLPSRRAFRRRWHRRCARARASGDVGEGIPARRYARRSAPDAASTMARAVTVPAATDAAISVALCQDGSDIDQAANTGAGSASSGSSNSATRAAIPKTTVRLARTAARHSGSIVRPRTGADAATNASMSASVNERFRHRDVSLGSCRLARGEPCAPTAMHGNIGRTLQPVCLREEPQARPVL